MIGTYKYFRVPPWMEVAFKELGVEEIPGLESNPKIDKYLAVTGMSPDDSIPWCAAYLSWVLEQTGIESTRKANARSYLSWGKEIVEPRLGCIVVLWRVSLNSESGHVGFFCGFSDDSRIFLLGGNQSDKVGIASYSTGRILSYKWPLKVGVSNETINERGLNDE